MKYIFLLILFYIGLPQNLFSVDFNKEGDCFNINDADSTRKYICYEIVGAKKYNVFIAEGDSVCDVFITDNRDRCVSTTCKKTPVLRWAFEEMSVELKNAEYTTNDDYQLFYYQLLLLEDGRQTFVESTRKSIVGENVLAKRLSELEQFLVRCWASEFVDKQLKIE